LAFFKKFLEFLEKVSSEFLKFQNLSRQIFDIDQKYFQNSNNQLLRFYPGELSQILDLFFKEISKITKLESNFQTL
jgi:hypothetical protein